MADKDKKKKQAKQYQMQDIENDTYCEVEIFDDVYKLVSNEYDFERLKHTASEVDAQMRIISEKYPDFPKYKIAILVALNVTDTLLKIKERESELSQGSSSDGMLYKDGITREEVIMRIEKLISDIDEVL
jgi:cell division protein ZapA (FtsZ GTPase activity inhibitor)